MVSAALVISYLFLVLVVVVIIVLFCLGCGCHVPLGKCVRCFCSNTTFCCNRCCKRKKKSDDGYKNIMDDVNEENAAKDEARARKKRVEDDTAIAGCCSWVPWVLTCGMCCGAFKDEEEEAAATPVSKGVAVAQPVTTAAHDLDDEVVGTEPVVAISIPLLSIR
jgi:hypothetical protein